MYPKVLLTNLQGIDRDHVWVDAEALATAIPRTNRTKLRIVFECDTKEYFSLREQGKITLTNITNLQVLGKVKS